MAYISRDNPCYYLTSVPKDRLPVFRSDLVKAVTCRALDEARRSGHFALYAYVIMPDHFHLITDSPRDSSEILRFVNGITGRRIIDWLKQNNHTASLEKLRISDRERQHRYSLWDHHPNVRLLWNESMLMERVHYTHQNPVRLGLVDRAEDYKWSSVRCWNNTMLEDEPLHMDIEKIEWRKR
ncbi:MAG: transposase [Acidobacteriota bacterium]|nr:transposase [Acidobacteriota bacterium]